MKLSCMQILSKKQFHYNKTLLWPLNRWGMKRYNGSETSTSELQFAKVDVSKSIYYTRFQNYATKPENNESRHACFRSTQNLRYLHLGSNFVASLCTSCFVHGFEIKFLNDNS